jgi:hypothetical protein
MIMRTTVTLDPDVEALVKKRMQERDLTFKQALNEAIRAGLAPKKRKPFRTPTFDLGLAPNVDWDKASHIVGELEDREILRKMAEGT